MRLPRQGGLALGLCLVWVLGGCSDPGTGAQGSVYPHPGQSATRGDSLILFCPLPMDLLAQVSPEGPPAVWTTRQAGRSRGVARLTCPAPGLARWALCPPPAPGRLMTFRPRSGRWRPMTWRPGSPAPASGPVPLPRLPADSPDFDDVTDLVHHLGAPLPPALRQGWPPGPVPVDPGRAVNGQVDLSACLGAAMALWNGDLAVPFFVAADRPVRGVRLVHLADRHLQPPLRIQLTRLDSLGGPLRMNLTVGNNYSGPRDSLYAVRGFVHELGHVLLLWGHSPDRDHVLWERGPPLVDGPSPDERKAALLRRGLPLDTDWSVYGPVSSDGARRGPWPPGVRP